MQVENRATVLLCVAVGDVLLHGYATFRARLRGFAAFSAMGPLCIAMRIAVRGAFTGVRSARSRASALSSLPSSSEGSQRRAVR